MILLVLLNRKDGKQKEQQTNETDEEHAFGVTTDDKIIIYVGRELNCWRNNIARNELLSKVAMSEESYPEAKSRVTRVYNI